MNFRNRWPHRQRAQTHPQPPPAACAPARRAGHPAGFSSHTPRGTTPPSTTPGRAAPHPTQSFRVVLGVGLPADVDQRESAPKPRAVWGQLLAPRERRSRAHGHDADTAAGAVLVGWADNVTTFTAERRASTDAGLGDRRGEIRAAAPLGCSHEAGRSAVHGGGRPPRHEIRRIGASAWLSCCPREPAGAGAARSRHGLVAIRPPWSNSDVHVVANFCREHEANLSAGDPCLCGAPGRQARTGETPSQPWRPPPLLAVPVVWRTTAL